MLALFVSAPRANEVSYWTTAHQKSLCYEYTCSLGDRRKGESTNSPTSALNVLMLVYSRKFSRYRAKAIYPHANRGTVLVA